jgi:hypothetical protein
MCEHDDNHTTERIAGISGAIFLFGLALLIWLGAVWPGILLLILVTAIPVVIAEEGLFGIWILAQAGLWMGGIALLVTLRWLWPGVLVLAGISALLVAIAPPDTFEEQAERTRASRTAEKPKRKRDMPLPHIAERLDEMDADDVEVTNNGFEPNDPLYHESGRESRRDT